VIGRPAFTLYYRTPAPADGAGADNRAGHSDDGGCATKPDQESAAINSCLLTGSSYIRRSKVLAPDGR
jgi:hypothetical protein